MFVVFYGVEICETANFVKYFHGLRVTWWDDKTMTVPGDCATLWYRVHWCLTIIMQECDHRLSSNSHSHCHYPLALYWHQLSSCVRIVSWTYIESSFRYCKIMLSVSKSKYYQVLFGFVLIFAKDCQLVHIVQKKFNGNSNVIG